MQNDKLKIKILFLVIIFGGVFGLARNSWAVCSWNGNSGTVAAPYAVTDLADCVSDAADKAGDVVINIPACDVTWTTDVDVDMTSGFSNVTSLSILGNGTIPALGSTGNTKITDKGINFTGVLGKGFRVANIYYSGAPTTYQAFLVVRGSSKSWRIDHITFDINDRALLVYGETYGLLDHCNGYSHSQFANVAENTNGSGGGNSSWIKGSALGSADAVYLEDNNIEYVNQGGEEMMMFCDGDQGGRIVVRHNILKNHYLGGHDASSNNRSVLQYEMYDNFLETTYTSSEDLIAHRGGTGVIFNNDMYMSVDGSWNYGLDGPIGLYNYRDFSLGTVGLWANDPTCQNSVVKGCLNSATYWSDNLCNSDADCGGIIGACVRIDGFSGTQYPCRDQIGTGDNASPQGSHPYLLWNNRVKIYAGNWEPALATVTRNGTYNIVKGRDYCEEETAMPTSCNSITTTYIPYTYPHPLQGERDIVSPTAPNGLAVN